MITVQSNDCDIFKVDALHTMLMRVQMEYDLQSSPIQYILGEIATDTDDSVVYTAKDVADYFGVSWHGKQGQDGLISVEELVDDSTFIG